MEKNLIYAIGKEQYALFLDNFNMSIRKGESEYIHHSRVAMKRLVAIKEYLNYSCSDDANEALNQIDLPVKPVYKASGKVRNLQVALLTISDYIKAKPPAEFIDYIMRKLQKRKNKYFQVANEISLLDEDMFSAFFSQLLNQAYKGNRDLFFQHLERNATLAGSLIEAHPPGKEWHDARRWFKRNYLLLQMFESDLLSHPETGKVVYYRHIEQLIGQWHDLMYLKKVTAKFEAKSGVESKELKSFKNEIADSMLKFEHEIRQSF
ncbi:CHAD domain-containing protein [Natronoflexus pectinivorans]|uniref:CHAD domain-containing protein n=1 Tax=Natronoflexus pectinivorans TaxID=682526 RepID=A0A4R2GKI3_9BACT|nr:CHAD domain-containing protein [Natronoflexus pectinivorans]TCO07899.1 CHAD domain-containing protein [Natronoflexus pectinivorans]